MCYTACKSCGAVLASCSVDAGICTVLAGWRRWGAQHIGTRVTIITRPGANLLQQHLHSCFFLPSILLLFLDFISTPPPQSSCLPSSCYPNSPVPFIFPSSFLAHLKRTLTSSLNFIPSCSALFLIYFPISHSEVCLIPVAVYPGSSSTHCSCCNLLFSSKGLPPKGNRSCFLVKLPPSALSSIFSVPTARIQLASTMHSLRPMTLPKYLLTGGESCWHCDASREAG